MVDSLIRWSVVLAVALLAFGSCNGASLTTCTANITEGVNDTIVLLYNRVTVPDNSSCMHYVWSLHAPNTTAYPTLFTSYTLNNHSICSQDCADFINPSNISVSIPGSVESEFSLGVVFTRLTEFVVNSKTADSVNVFNDSLVCHCEVELEDELCQNYTENYNSMDLNTGNWSWFYFENNQTFEGIRLDPDFGNFTNTSISITIGLPTTNSSDGERLPYFPQTLFFENSSTFDVVIKNFPYELVDPFDTEAKTAGRLALEVYLIHGPNTLNGSVGIDTSLDDEYTPSMFQTNTYQLETGVPEQDGYLQWKPISYQSLGRKSTESQLVNMKHTAGDLYCDTMVIPFGLAHVVFANHSSNVTRWFAVFGTPGDDTYLNGVFFTWTSVVGYGRVPHDTISQVVIITIIVGLGIPGALVLLGAVYVFIKKKPWQSVKRLVNKVKGSQQGYTKLN